ncbi:hypothetical protein CCH79_00016725, partial [Gambusia affinis]
SSPKSSATAYRRAEHQHPSENQGSNSSPPVGVLQFIDVLQIDHVKPLCKTVFISLGGRYERVNILFSDWPACFLSITVSWLPANKEIQLVLNFFHSAFLGMWI